MNFLKRIILKSLIGTIFFGASCLLNCSDIPRATYDNVRKVFRLGSKLVPIKNIEEELMRKKPNIMQKGVRECAKAGTYKALYLRAHDGGELKCISKLAVKSTDGWYSISSQELLKACYENGIYKERKKIIPKKNIAAPKEITEDSAIPSSWDDAVTMLDSGLVWVVNGYLCSANGETKVPLLKELEMETMRGFCAQVDELYGHNKPAVRARIREIRQSEKEERQLREEAVFYI